MAIVLVATLVGLFAGTAMLYLAQSRQQALLAVTIRTSGWVAYQARIEYMQTHFALEVAARDPAPDQLREMELRLEILASRLPLLYQSQEGRMLPDMEAHAATIRGFSNRVSAMLDETDALLPDSPATSTRLRQWDLDLAPLGTLLQKLLMASVAYNDALYERERVLASNTTIVPLALIFLCGMTLVGVLVARSVRDRRNLQIAVEAREAEAVTRASLHAALDAIPAVIVVFDPAEDSVAYINPTAAAAISPQPDHPGWRELLSYFHARVVLRGSGADDNMSVTISGPKGEVISLRGSRRQIVWGGRKLTLLAMADVSQGRAAELKVLQAAKLATLGEMASAIAHEINQPLAVMKMAVANGQRLLATGAAPEAVAAKLTRIDEQIDRARRITDQVRRHAHMPSPQMSAFAVQQAIQLAISFVAEQYRVNGIRLVLALDFPAETMVLGEQTMFEQVIVNLLVNARDAFGERTDGDKTVTVAGHLEPGQIVLAVEDTAGGIPAEMLGHLFDPFVTSKPADKGTGLGLSIARTVIRDMNGTIRAGNTDRGALFTIALPLASGHDAREQETRTRGA